MNKKENEGFKNRICPICGKTFLPAPFHIYKVKGRLVCTWGCLRKYEKGEAKIKEKKDEN